MRIPLPLLFIALLGITACTVTTDPQPSTPTPSATHSPVTAIIVTPTRTIAPPTKIEPTATQEPTEMPTTPPTSTPSPTVAQGGLADLAEFQWANRLIVMFAAPTAVAELQATLIAEDAAVIDRQILWFIVADDAVTTNYGGALSNQLAANLRSRYAQLDTDLEVVLIGKDSGVKNRQPFLDSAAIYGQIDEMPMRRAEMTKQAAP